ncbi:MAG TPA: RnfABCDGE type electron transport complex subunit G [Desulfobacteraceae bacterium]|nr:RnfABCDGE type electron transport complex subunit G [Desulfobacteraceae bacterium]
MREMISMVVVLTVLSAFAGGLLAAVKSGTEKRIENQILKFQKAPAIRQILSDVANDPMKDRFKIQDKDQSITFFVGKQENSTAVAFETKGKGYGGDIGLMVGIDLGSDEVVGMRVTTHAETPGLGSRAKDDTSFVSQFAGLSIKEAVFAVKNNGGDINAMSGATVTSKGLCVAASRAQELYLELKPEINQQIKQLAN